MLVNAGALAGQDRLGELMHAELLEEVDRLTDGNKIARPRRTRDRDGRWTRDPAAEYDWFYALPESERTFIQTHYMTDGGVGPDVVATWLAMSVDEAMGQWVDAIRAARRKLSAGDPLADDYFDQMEAAHADGDLLRDALEVVRQQTNLTDDEWRELVDLCAKRAFDPEFRDRDVIAEAPSTTDIVWNPPPMSSWCSQHDLARVLAVKPGRVRQWNNRGKLPPPEEYVNGRPCWSRKTAQRWCEELVELAR